MEVYIHIGPHKTGTSTVQRALRLRYEAGDVDGVRLLRHPTKTANELGIDLLRGGSLLLDGVNAAAADGVRKLVFSAEALCLAGAAAKRRLSEALEPYWVTLIMTLSQPSRRIGSMWQENVKHFHTDTLFGEPEKVLRHPSFEPRLFESYCEELAPDQATLIIIGRNDPQDQLLRSFARALGIAALPPAGSMNTSLGLAEAEAWRAINMVIKDHFDEYEHYPKVREALAVFFASKSWKAASPGIKIVLNDVLKARGAELDELTYLRLTEVAGRPDVRIYGKLESLIE